jgi:hypothetical protein
MIERPPKREAPEDSALKQQDCKQGRGGTRNPGIDNIKLQWKKPESQEVPSQAVCEAKTMT